MIMAFNNFLETNRFLLVIPSFEATRFLSTSFQLPQMDLPSARADTPFSPLKFAGDKVEFSPVEFEFIVDENMTNWKEVYDWFMSIGYVRNHKDFKEYEGRTSHQPLAEQDIKIVILNSKENPVATYTFYNAIPVSLSGMPMTSTVNDVDYVRSTVIFDYDYFDFDIENPVE